MPNAVSILWHASSAVALASFLGLAACGGPTYTPGDKNYAASVEPGTRAPASKVEEAILLRLGDLAPDMPETIEGHSVSAGRAYQAASGRVCRPVQISGEQPRQSLACLMPGGWAFVPSIFAEEASSS